MTVAEYYRCMAGGQDTDVVYKFVSGEDADEYDYI